MENAINKQFHDKVSSMFFDFSPRWCLHSDFDYALQQGYVNSVCSNEFGATTSYACKKSKENGMPVWVIAPIYIPSMQSVDEYIARMDKLVEKYKNNGNWDTITGFMWCEPLLENGHTKEAFLEMTKALTETYGKRIFAKFSLGELFGDGENCGALEKQYTKYITDVGFALYDFDMRDENQEKLAPALKALGEKENAEFKTAADLYQHYTDKMLSLMEKGDDVRVWYFPAALEGSCFEGGIVCDEAYCTGHLVGLKDLLLKQKNPGGLCIYRYKFTIEDHVHPRSTDAWPKYEEAIKNVCKELTEVKTK